MNLHNIPKPTINDRLVRWLNVRWRNTHDWRTTDNPAMLQYNFLIPSIRADNWYTTPASPWALRAEEANWHADGTLVE
jgi:hypothetical protein